MGLQQYDDLSFRQIHSHAIFFLMGGYGPQIEMGEEQPSFPSYSLRDDFPPFIVITSVEPLSTGETMVRGTSVDNTSVDNTAVDNTAVAGVTVNGNVANSVRDGFAEWQVILAEMDGG